jgi:hypothetical protein
VTYEVMCVCGELLRGERQRRHQVVTCPNCGRAVFVLPASALDVLEEPAAAPAGRSWLRSWRIPLLAGAGSLLLLLGLFLAIRPFLLRPLPVTTEAEPHAGKEVDVLSRIKSSRLALAEGRFRLALRGFNEAISERQRQPRLLSGAEMLELRQLQRQADVLAHLSPLPLEEIVERAMQVRDADERSALLDEFRGKAVIFDDTVIRDPLGPSGRWLKLGSYVAQVEGKGVRLALEDLDVLRDLPLDDAPRLVFGARFAGAELEKSGDEKSTGWVVRFAADSGVLFTDEDALESASPVSLQPGLKETLLRQKEWLIERRLLQPERQ